MSANMPPSSQRLERGDFVRLCYRLGHSRSTGVLSLALDGGKAELLILRRGQVFTRDSDALGRETRLRLERLTSAGCLAHFDRGLAAYPPSLGRPFSLTEWARQHLEAQLDSTRAQDLVRELAGVRLAIVMEQVPEASTLDATDQRIIAAMGQPRRLDQIWPLARTPRFRLLSFVHFLRSVGALREAGVAAHPRPAIGTPGRQAEAMRTLGLTGHSSLQEVKQAYRRLARQLHPDLNGSKSHAQRRLCEQRLSDVNSAYRELISPR